MLEDLLQFGRNAVDRVKKTPLSEYFLPTSKTFRQNVGNLGSVLQKFPSTKLTFPEVNKKYQQAVSQPGLKGILAKNVLSGPKQNIDAVSFLSDIPGEMVRSYGRTATKATSGEKLGFEDYLNMSDFMPGIGIVGLGSVKAIGKKALKEAGEEVVEKAAVNVGKETLEKWLKTEGSVLGRIIKRVFKGEKPLELPVQEIKYSLADASPMAKTNVLDYIRTPEFVLDRLGLKKEADALRTGYESYQTTLRSELTKIRDWKKIVNTKDGNRRLFDFLDGQLTPGDLTPKELQVAKEIKTTLTGWADNLGIPKEGRITDYISHLFEGQRLPGEVADKIKTKTDEITKDLFDPFLMEREGAEGFVKDTWRALEAYTKSGARKLYLEQPIGMIAAAADRAPLETQRYLKNFSDQALLKKKDLDQLVDNLITGIPVVGKRLGDSPSRKLSRTWRDIVYRGALGMNFSSALRNMTQGVNTYSLLGEKNTLLGYADAVKHIATKDFEELIANNVLSDNILERSIADELGVTKKVLKRMDDALFAMFDFAEKINRSSAYFGAKRKALAQGKNITEAIDFAKNVVRKTQFNYSAIDTPLAMGGDVAKALTQFGTFPIKQSEFLVNLAKDKNYIGLLRYTASSLAIAATVGKAFGMRLSEFVPFTNIRFNSPLTQAMNAVSPLTPEEDRQPGKIAPLVIPGGVQLKKSLQGMISGGQGYTETPTGRVRYPVGDSTAEKLQLLLFGPSATSQAREYYGKDRSPLGEAQSRLFKVYGLPYYDRVMQERAR